MNALLPQVLLSRLQMILSDDFSSVLDSFSKNRKWSFRLNLLKTDGREIFLEFAEKNISVEKFTSLDGVYVFDRDQEYAIKGTRAFYDGKIYLQSIASLLPVLTLAPRASETILDVCAAPGSKTTQISMLMKNTGSIIAIEQNQIRYDKLMYNCKLQGATNITGAKLDALKYFEGDFEVTDGEIHKKGKYARPSADVTHLEVVPLFDRILLDAPCSAEGRISLENEKSYGFWSLDNISRKAELQSELLGLAFSKLKKWGTLIYSTCTLAPEENEWVLASFLSKNPNATLESIDIWLSDQSWWKSGITEFDGKFYGDIMKKTVRILPSEQTEGFFMARIVKGENLKMTKR